MKILIVDDSKAMRMIVRRTLNQAGFTGHEIVEAENGAIGLEQVEAESPDLVLSDFNMPEMNGQEFLAELRERGVDIPFGFITSEASVENRDQAKQNGASFVICKPFTPDMFSQHLESIIVG